MLQALLEDGQIVARAGDEVAARRLEGAGLGLGLGPADEREEKCTFWFLAKGQRRWYQV